jgi:hypothetical protein
MYDELCSDRLWNLVCYIDCVWEQGAEEIFEPKKDEGMRGWRKLHIEQFHSFTICILWQILLRW